MATRKYLNVLLATAVLLISLILFLIVYINYQKQYSVIINSFLELEANIIEEASRMSKLWLNKRLSDQEATIEQIEQEILINFIDPINLLENGDAWIYNKDYVIFDKSRDFPDEYKGKSMRQIFEIQSKSGAYHFEEMTEGVENATEGRGWYVWLPEKGKEWVAWTSFGFRDQTWTLGLSTPEKEIIANTNLSSFIKKQIFNVLLLIIILVIVVIVILNYEKKQEKLIEKINQTNTALKNIDNMKNEFIANISHDFRTPLSIIFNLAELNIADAQKIPFKVKEDFEVIYNTSFKFLSKVNTLLDLTKIETHGLNLKITRVRLSEFLDMITNYYKSLLKYSGIEISLKDNKSDSEYFYTDIEKLEDIINNIMSNAIKFITHKNGKILIELKETQSWAEIKITDNGIGIEKENLEKIFKRYKKLSGPANLVYFGSGIGMAYSKQLLELLGGSIKADSSGIKKGTTFTLLIDKERFGIKDASDAAVKQFIPKRMVFDTNTNNFEKTMVSITDTNRQNEFNKYKGIILVVEDEYAIRDIIIRYLQNEGYKNFIAVDNGETAIDMMHKYHPDLVITDFQMPGMNGSEFYKTIHSNPDFDFIPFIFLSAIADEQLILEQKLNGAEDFLIKPIKKSELIISVNSKMKKYMDFMKVSGIDELTKLYNRRVFFKNFENIVLSPAISNFSLMMLDLDHFKAINDKYGHLAGDQILTQVGSKILDVIRSQDLAGRYGGEEFVILLPETNLKHSKIVAEKIRTSIKELALNYNDEIIGVTVSIGLASMEQCRTAVEKSEENINYITTLTGMADTALYIAKSGRDRVEIYSNDNRTENIV